MKKTLFNIIGSLAMAAGSVAEAATLITWGSTIDDGDFEATTTANITSGTQMLGAGLSQPSTFATSKDNTTAESPVITGGEVLFISTGVGTEDDTADLVDAIADNQYYELSIGITGLVGGETIDLTDFNYSTRRNASSGAAISGFEFTQIRYSVNSGGFVTVGTLNNNATFAVEAYNEDIGAITGLVNGDTVDFRIYAWGTDYDGVGDDTQASTRIGAISVEGAVIPEPSSMVLMLLAGGAILFMRRKFRV